MAEDIIQFQDGREAAIAGKRRDRRRSADWLEGHDQVTAADRDQLGATPDMVRKGGAA